MTAIYATYFGFCFYTGMRPSEVMALRWSEIDRRGKATNVCRIQIRGMIQDRTKTKRIRKVLLNDRALHALEKARPLTEARSDYVIAPSGRVTARRCSFAPRRVKNATGWQHCESLVSGAAGCTTRATRTRPCA